MIYEAPRCNYQLGSDTFINQRHHVILMDRDLCIGDSTSCPVLMLCYCILYPHLWCLGSAGHAWLDFTSQVHCHYCPLGYAWRGEKKKVAPTKAMTMWKNRLANKEIIRTSLAPSGLADHHAAILGYFPLRDQCVGLQPHPLPSLSLQPPALWLYCNFHIHLTILWFGDGRSGSFFVHSFVVEVLKVLLFSVRWCIYLGFLMRSVWFMATLTAPTWWWV